MKQSIFNTCIQLDNGFTIVYNAFSDKYVVCGSEAISIDGHQIHNCSELVRARLEEIGAYVADDVDEQRMLEERIERVDNDSACFELHVNPTLNCNFRCWYCYEEHLPGSKMDAATIEALCRLISLKLDETEGLKSFNLSFFGGEPLLYYSETALPVIRHAVKACADRGVHLWLHFTTNAYLLSEQILESIGDVDASFQITLDGAREQHDKVRFQAGGKGSYDAILSNARRAASYGKHIILRINYTADSIATVGSIADELREFGSEKRNITIDLQRVWQDNGCAADEERVQDDVDRMYRLFRSEGFMCSTPYIRNSVLDSCYGDKRNSILINYNGDAFFCTARDFKSADRAGFLASDGRIVWENNALERRMAAKYKSAACRQCRIAPICGGGCRQRAVEMAGSDDCLVGFSDRERTERVVRRFEQMHIPA